MRIAMRLGGLMASALCAVILGGCPANSNSSGDAGAEGPAGPAGATGPQGPAGPQGAQGDPGAAGTNGQDGAPGQPGADGQLRIYGNGHAGTRVVANGEDWFDVPDAPVDPEFTDLTIPAGVTLDLPNGFVLRCSGTFTNNGTILIHAGAQGGTRNSNVSSMADGPAHPGLTGGSAGFGEIGDNAHTEEGGNLGNIVDQSYARMILNPGPYGGGGGATGFAGTGGSGGGTLVVLARSGIVNTGTIHADGDDASSPSGGGGGGGIVILASAGSISNSGTITVKGGHGADGTTTAAAGGGGGGGIIHFLAPTLSIAGATDVSAGANGDNSNMVSGTPRAAGGGGGGCGGFGGAGASITNTGGLQSGVAGAVDGLVLQSVLDPTALF